MSRILHVAVFAMLGASLFAIRHVNAVQQNGDAPTVRIASGEWEPWTSASLPHHGIANRIVKEAFAASGYGVEFGFFPWPRALALTQSGRWDATAAWIRTPKRERTFLFSNPIFESRTVLFHRAAEPITWDSLADLKGKTLGLTKGYAYGPRLAAAIEKNWFEIDQGPSDESGFKKLAAGRIDLFPIDEFVGLALLQQALGERAKRITYDAKPIARSTNHLMVPKTHPHAATLITAFNRGLAAARKTANPRGFLERHYNTACLEERC